MTTNAEKHRLRVLVDLLAENKLDESGIRELEELVANNDELKLLYLDDAQLRFRLRQWANNDQPPLDLELFNDYLKTIDDAQVKGTATAARPRVAEGVHGRSTTQPTGRRSTWVQAVAAISAVLLISALIHAVSSKPAGSVVTASRDAPVKGQGDAENEKAPSEQIPAPQPYVARVSGITDDVSWGSSSTRHELLLRLRVGDRLELTSGMVELDFFSGANIILHGPGAFMLTGANSGQLDHGQLTGNVSQGDFVLTTPTAEVIDLGTAFGVSVQDPERTEVCVFDGKVRVSSTGHADDASKSLLLNKGMAAHISGDHIEHRDSIDAFDLARVLPAQRVDRMHTTKVSLVDLFNGVRGNRYGLTGVVDPVTGEAREQAWLWDSGPGDREGDGEYHTTDWHDILDGVFIPNKAGRQVQVDSSGSHVTLPRNLGASFGPIWARRRLAMATPQTKQGDFWGTDTLQVILDRLDYCRDGIIGIHSNVGMSFDMDQVRAQWEREIRSFRGVVTNLNNSQERLTKAGKLHRLSTRYSADFRIFVDGQLRYSRLDFARADGDEDISIPIKASDRFVTFVSTDMNGDNAFDHVLLIDPVFMFSE